VSGIVPKVIPQPFLIFLNSARRETATWILNDGGKRSASAVAEIRTTRSISRYDDNCGDKEYRNQRKSAIQGSRAGLWTGRTERGHETNSLYPFTSGGLPFLAKINPALSTVKTTRTNPSAEFNWASSLEKERN
jgi:hypothetical protein